MKREKSGGGREPARPYFRAFYKNNRLCWCAAMLFTIISSAAMAAISWILGDILDTAAAGDSSKLMSILRMTVIIGISILASQVIMYRLKAVFLRRAARQYKSLAFEKLAQKSISAFSRENTGRYISILTNDVKTVEEGYLKNGFNGRR